MTDLERVLDLVENSVSWAAVRSIIDTHLQEDAAREADRDRERGLWTSWERRYRETEAELARLREENEGLRAQRDALYAMRNAWAADGPSDSETRAMLREAWHQRDTLLAALEEIAYTPEYAEDDHASVQGMRGIAHAAISEVEGEK